MKCLSNILFYVLSASINAMEQFPCICKYLNNI